MIEKKRQVIIEKLCEVKQVIDLEYNTKELRELLLDKVETENQTYFVINEEMMQVLNKIDLSKMSFDHVKVYGFDFSNLTGVKINPRTVYLRDLSWCNCSKVEFICDNSINKIDLFEDVAIDGTKFNGSKGAIINPRTVYKKNLEYCSFGNVIFSDIYEHISQEDLFEDAKIYKTNFSGSVGVMINPQKLYSFEMGECIFKDVEFIGPFDNTTINGANFTGSKGAVIDLNNLGWTNGIIYDINFRDAMVIGNLTNIYWASNIKTIGAKMNLMQQGKLLTKRFSYLISK